MAARQFGQVSWAQLRSLGVDRRTIHRWLKTGYLHGVRPRVYAVGHPGGTVESDLAAALLYAGPGACLSHATAAWWFDLVDSKPYMIEVRTPRRCRSIPGIRVHPSRNLERISHNRLPVTPLSQTLLDYASTASLSKLRRALAKADYHGFDVGRLEAELARGRPGSARLRTALKNHQPKLALTRSRLEMALYELCESARIPLPEINADIAGWTVDALWRRERLVVEVDGPSNHRTPAQIRRDRRKDFDLRAAGLTVLRYADEQVTKHERLVAAEIQHNLTNPGPSA
jgi:very-short-patch-repair endonuclease/predicted transcriptional regulator of viral defense system